MTPKAALHAQSVRLIASRAVVEHGRCDPSAFPLEMLLDRLCRGRFEVLGDDVVIDGPEGSWTVSTPPDDGWIHRTGHPEDGALLRVSFDRDQSLPPGSRALGLVAWAMTIRDSRSHPDEVSAAAIEAGSLLDRLAHASATIPGIHDAQLWIYPRTLSRGEASCGIAMPDGSNLGPNPGTSAAVARLRPIISMMPGSSLYIQTAFWQRTVTSDPGRRPTSADENPFA